MGTIKATNIEPIADNGTVTLGSSGDTFSLGSGVKQSNILYPAFEAFLTSDQTVSDATLTKCQVNSEIYDTDNCYDNSTNYRFTPNVAGRYNVYGALHFEADADNRLAGVEIAIYKNGSVYSDLPIQFYTNYEKKMTPFISSVISLNGSSDYVELYGWNNVTTGTATFGGNASVAITYFGAYRIGT